MGVPVNTPYKGSGGAGRCSAPSPAEVRRLSTHSPLPACPQLRDGVPDWGVVTGPTSGAETPTVRSQARPPPLPILAQPSFCSHSAQESFGVPTAPPSPRGLEFLPTEPRHLGGKFVRPGLHDWQLRGHPPQNPRVGEEPGNRAPNAPQPKPHGPGGTRPRRGRSGQGAGAGAAGAATAAGDPRPPPLLPGRASSPPPPGAETH